MLNFRTEAIFCMWLLATFHIDEKISSEHALATFPWAYSDLAHIFAACGLAGCVLLCSVWVTHVSNLFMYASRKHFAFCDWSVSCHAAIAVESCQAKSKHLCLVSEQVFLPSSHAVKLESSFSEMYLVLCTSPEIRSHPMLGWFFIRLKSAHIFLLITVNKKYWVSNMLALSFLVLSLALQKCGRSKWELSLVLKLQSNEFI